MSANAVTPKLWQGSVPEAGKSLPFDLVVLCAVEHQFEGMARPFGRRARVLRCPLRDCAPLSHREVKDALRAAVEVAHAYSNGLTTVVTCAMGLNRSGLVMALSLVELGIAPNDAVAAVRRARPNALCNPYFVQIIHEVAGRSVIRIPIERGALA